ncbi:MAG: hypothetical protein GY793_08635 [Proteobacteria bacterium]|nr:hypothetical protein [Pseudomonadota bacterium]
MKKLSLFIITISILLTNFSHNSYASTSEYQELLVGKATALKNLISANKDFSKIFNVLFKNLQKSNILNEEQKFMLVNLKGILESTDGLSGKPKNLAELKEQIQKLISIEQYVAVLSSDPRSIITLLKDLENSNSLDYKQKKTLIEFNKSFKEFLKGIRSLKPFD